ncbi:MAG: FAD-binding oxidoreductase [Phycisphaerales bacterium]|nr:FAD-binding oxidoreductase [Phycisphaerales bacterium]
MTVPWWKQPGRVDRVRAQAIVVGAGVTGLSAAMHMERRGVRPIVLERQRVASGASGRNAGFLMRGVAESYAAACDSLGRELTQHAWRFTEDNLRALRELGVDHTPGFGERPSCLLALNDAEAHDLERSASLMAEDGFESPFITEGDDDAWKNASPLCGLVNPGDAVCDPQEVMALLASKLDAEIRPNAEVTAINASPDRIEVVTHDAVYEADLVLLCVNAWARTLSPQLARLVEPNRAQMLALDAPGAKLDMAYYANEGGEYIRAGEGGVVLVGGCRRFDAEAERTLADEATDPVQSGIEAFAERVLGRRYPVLRRWSGPMGFSPDGLPIVGRLSEVGGPDAPIHFCGGFTGHGMSMGHLTARDCVEHALDDRPTPWTISRFSGRTTG